MKRSKPRGFALLALFVLVSGARAETDDGLAASPPRPATQAASPQIPIARVEAVESKPADDAPAGDGKDKARFSSEASWTTAGYNNDEVVYTIFVSNEDARILRCSVQIKGSYLDKGRRLPVEDRQLATVFPDQKVQVGNWMGMDPIAGVTYTVGCRVR
jgi:hypothetical protein